MSNAVQRATVAILLAPIVAAAGGWQKFGDPSGVLSLRVPGQWRAEKPMDMGFSQMFSFRLLEEGAEFTISITPNLRLPDELPLRMAERFFPPGAAVGPAHRSKGEGWNAIRQDARAEIHGQSRGWLGIFYGVGATMVAVTLSDRADRIDSHRSVFTQIVESIRVQSASSPGSRPDDPIT